MMQMSIFVDCMPWKLCRKEGHPQRPEMRRGRGNPASNFFFIRNVITDQLCTHLV